MIIRSGLIRRREDISFEDFTRHWTEVHAPLVTKIDGLRGYAQNHLTRRTATNEGAFGLHRVDGISQLVFDSIEGMTLAMQSPEQDACIADLRGLLSDVTLLIQELGHSIKIGEVDTGSLKSMSLLRGDAAAARSLVDRLTLDAINTRQACRIRLNKIVAKDVVVDSTIPAGRQVIDFVLETWTPEGSDLGSSERLGASRDLELVASFQMREIVVVPFPPTSTQKTI